MDIRLERLCMDFGSVKAVDQLTVTIEAGTLVSLLGPSGCGKSTTLFLLAGIYKPTGGAIFFGEQQMNLVEPEHRGIGMVFQNYALYPHMTVAENIMFPLKMQKMKKPERWKQAEKMAKLVQINHLMDRKPSQLSGGQQQRVAIARALAKQPKLLLLDEPLSNLDARLRLETREEIRRIQQETGVTTVFVTHDQEEAMSISDKVLLMKDGRCQQYSRPQRMYREPANLFAASFMGNPPINLMEAKWDIHGKSIQLRGMDTSFEISDSCLHRTSLPDEIVVGVRAEDWVPTEDLTRAAFIGELTHFETIGRDTLIRVQSGTRFVRGLVEADMDLHIGKTVGLGIKKEKIHIFDAATGINIRTSMGGSMCMKDQL